MYPLLEDRTKEWLAGSGFPVPKGQVATSAEAASVRLRQMPAGAAIKALVPTGRRSKAGAVRLVADAADARVAANGMLGSKVAGFRVDRVWVEEQVDIAEELYLSFSLIDERPHVLASRRGGVDIEEVFAEAPEAVARLSVDPLRDLADWQTMELWLDCGITGALLPKVAKLTARLYAAFRSADALTLELNPIAVGPDGTLSLVGAMMAVDEDALFRHPEWGGETAGGESAKPREERVRNINREISGGECRYVELDGDIGLLVGGGGAGLYLHDLIVELGGQPANHCVTPPTGSDTRKLKAVLDAIFDNPRTKSLLVGFNFAQMARADIRLRTLAEVLRERKLDTRRLPIVVRLFGPGENEARAIAAEFPGMTYLPRGTTLRQAAQAVVDATAALDAEADA